MMEAINIFDKTNEPISYTLECDGAACRECVGLTECLSIIF